MELGQQFSWLPQQWVETGSVLQQAERPFNAQSTGNKSREMTGQPQTGVSESDVQRKTYGYYNAAKFDPPKVTNDFLKPKSL